MTEEIKTAVVMAGSPSINAALYRRLRFSVVDSVVLIELDAGVRSVLILRDIEMERAARNARVTDVHCPADFTPVKGLSGNRETATAQAAAECLRRSGVSRVIGDRSLPLIYVEMIRRAGIAVECDSNLGILDRRQKDEEEVACLRESQRITEKAIEMACRMIAVSDADSDGSLHCEGEVLTSERVRFEIDQFLLSEGFTNPSSIVAGGPIAADCHNFGSGPLKTSSPVIVDVFPTNRATRYCGDCTRTVVHGDIHDEVARMHVAVGKAKQAGISATRAGVTGESVHEATLASIVASGYSVGLPDSEEPDTYCGMTHGTGHGIGLEVHEPPLLDFRGPELLEGDALTIEPGLYCKAIGAVRLEDMVIVGESGCENLNRLPEGLSWK
ncbi:MAG: aminopeptidase P family protein [Opitutales bacterium]|nr:aminopeptidase P family protein [Opitutales bacterium]